MGEVIKFPNAVENTGYTKFNEFAANLQTHFEELNDPAAVSNTSEMIAEKKEAVLQIVTRLEEIIESIDGVQVKLPTPSDFAVYVENILLLPFTNQDRVSEGYYNLLDLGEHLNNAYLVKYREISRNQLNQI